MASIEVFLVHEKKILTDAAINGSDDGMMRGWLLYSLFSVTCAILASVLTVYYGPGATGSGITELICYLNGVNYPKLMSFESLFTKIFGVIGAVVGNLCVGKEGPMAHIGACIGAGVAYFPLPNFEYLRNDWTKRELISAGISAGVSSAFGAPVGGALFAYEMSKPNTFWQFSVLWRSFFSCAVAVLTMSIVRQLMTGGNLNDITSVSELKFAATNVASPDLSTIPAAIIIGIICGILGAGFIFFNLNLNKCRKKIIKWDWLKVIEVALFSFATSSVFFWAPYKWN